MIGIIIAAGTGSRMKNFTKNKPKCFLKIGEKTLLERSYDNLINAGCGEVYVITGHFSEKIEKLGYKTIFNSDFKNNNILHSFFKACSLFNDDIIVTYSDIYVEPYVFRELALIKSDIVLTIDKDWEDYYLDRDNVPLSQAEKLSLNKDNIIREIGKHIILKKNRKYYEFIGLFKVTKNGCQIIKKRFFDLNDKLSKSEIFISKRAWNKAYITDFLDFIIKKNRVKIFPHIISKGWVEFDTIEDYKKLKKTKVSQKLISIKN